MIYDMDRSANASFGEVVRYDIAGYCIDHVDIALIGLIDRLLSYRELTGVCQFLVAWYICPSRPTTHKSLEQVIEAFYNRRKCILWCSM